MIGLAQTGTGKTAAFGLPLISAVMDGETQALVMCPTRELCLQITNELTPYAKYIPGFNIIAVYGGAILEPNLKNYAERTLLSVLLVDYLIIFLVVPYFK